jgi:hypothetical protein
MHTYLLKTMGVGGNVINTIIHNCMDLIYFAYRHFQLYHDDQF